MQNHEQQQKVWGGAFAFRAFFAGLGPHPSSAEGPPLCALFLRRAGRAALLPAWELRAAVSLVAPGWGTSKPGWTPDPGRAAPPALCPRRGRSCH